MRLRGSSDRSNRPAEVSASDAGGGGGRWCSSCGGRGGIGGRGGWCAKALTGIDDHSRMCVSAKLMARERTRPGLLGAAPSSAAVLGCPRQTSPTTARCSPDGFSHPPVEVLFDRICRENGIEHLLTQPRGRCRHHRQHRALSTALWVASTKVVYEPDLIVRSSVS